MADEPRPVNISSFRRKDRRFDSNSQMRQKTLPLGENWDICKSFGWTYRNEAALG
jgi:hypothetical protein